MRLPVSFAVAGAGVSPRRAAFLFVAWGFQPQAAEGRVEGAPYFVAVTETTQAFARQFPFNPSALVRITRWS